MVGLGVIDSTKTSFLCTGNSQRKHPTANHLRSKHLKYLLFARAADHLYIWIYFYPANSPYISNSRVIIKCIYYSLYCVFRSHEHIFNVRLPTLDCDAFYLSLFLLPYSHGTTYWNDYDHTFRNKTRTGKLFALQQRKKTSLKWLLTYMRGNLKKKLTLLR